MSTLATNAITDASGGNTATINSYTPTESNMAGRNRIINGDMRIDQRNAGASATPTGYVTIDRFRCGNNNNTGTIQRITSTLAGFQNSVKYTSAGSCAFFQFGQQIEFVNCSDLQGQTVTITFRAKANKSNTGSTGLIVRTRNGAGVDSSVIFAGTAVNTNITLTTSDALYTISRTLPATFGSLSVEFTIGSHVSGDGFEITGVQLEAGSVATPFERRQYGQELALCQRYYYNSYPSGSSGIGHTFAGGVIPSAASIAECCVGFPISMRTAPTVTFPDGLGQSGVAAASASTASQIDTTGFLRGNKSSGSFTSASSLVTGGFIASAEL